MKALLLILSSLVPLAPAFFHSIDLGKNTQQMATAHNYPCENYTVTTADGYVLLLFRIPGRRYEPLDKAKLKRRQPAILQHGMLDSSDTFLVNEAPALAYMLADSGYDVWLGNFRGNKYSRRHVKLDPDADSEYWDFSIDQLIKFDLKAIFSLVIKVTRYQRVVYVGHSMGGGSLLAAATRAPEFYARHVKAFVGLAPATRSIYAHAILKIAHHVRILEILEMLGIHEILNDKRVPHDLLAAFCERFPSICHWFLRWFCDKQPEYNNIKKFLVFVNHYPSGTSNHVMKQLVQQSVHDGYYEYQKDSGKLPAEYDFGRFPERVPVGILAGRADLLVNVRDTDWLRSKLGRAVRLYREYHGYGHLTFLLPGKCHQAYRDVIAFLMECE